MNRLICLSIAIGALAAGATAAEDADAKAPPAPRSGLEAGRPVVNKPLALPEAVAIALKESPVVRGAEEEVRMAAARVGMARAAALPTLSATGYVTGGGMTSLYSTPAPAMPQSILNVPRGTFGDGNLTLMYPLFTGGRLSGLIRQAQAARGASAADLEAMRRDLALETKTAYRGVLLAQAAAAIYRALSDTAEERLRIDRVVFDAGRIPKFYLLRDEAEAANAQQLLVNARRDVDVALVVLTTTMGIAQESQVTLADKLEHEPMASTREQLMAMAERQRPELAAARQRLEGARQGVSVARSAYLPQVSIAAMGDTMKASGMNGFTGATAGLLVGLPILDGGMRRSQVSEARAGERRAQDEYQRVALQVVKEVDTSLLALQAAESNIRTAETALAAAEENYRVAQLRYTEGRGINVEVLDALAAFTRAQTNRVQALYDYNVARDQLLRATGQ